MVVRVKTDCGDCASHPELTPGNYYRVIAISPRFIRLMSDAGETALYEKTLSDIVSDTRPADWIEVYDGDGPPVFIGPRCLSARGFFEDLEDGDAKTRAIFKRRIEKWIGGEDYIVNVGALQLDSDREIEISPDVIVDCQVDVERDT